VIVARMSDERLEVVQAREASVGRGGRPTSSAASRRARVERSRQRAAAARDGVVGTDDTIADDEVDDTDLEADESVADDVEVEIETDEETVADEGTVADEEAAPAGIKAGEYPGSVLPDDEGNAPEGFEIKGNAQSRLYHTPDSRYYKATKAEVYFDSVESAEAAGFSAPATAATDEAKADDTDEKDD
jgi:large subunit ribosomal protein L22